VKHACDVIAIDDFSAGQIAHAAEEPDAYSVALVFSTKYDPDSPFERLSGETLDQRYFGLHHDLPPEAIAHQLGGDLVWKRDDDGMWIALIHFNHPVEAMLERIPSR
jgi:hypothetical protein